MPARTTAPPVVPRSADLSPASLCVGEHRYRIVDLPAAAGAEHPRLPWVFRLLLENVLRTSADAQSAGQARAAILAWLENDAHCSGKCRLLFF